MIQHNDESDYKTHDGWGGRENQDHKRFGVMTCSHVDTRWMERRKAETTSSEWTRSQANDKRALAQHYHHCQHEKLQYTVLALTKETANDVMIIPSLRKVTSLLTQNQESSQTKDAKDCHHGQPVPPLIFRRDIVLQQNGIAIGLCKL